MHLLNLAKEAGLAPKWAAGTQGGEYHSSCPACGGKDRFYIQPLKQQRRCLGYYRCRQCNIYGDTIQFGRDFLALPLQDAAERAHADLITSSNPPARAKSFRQPPSQWHVKASIFNTWAHQKILKEPTIMAYLESRGLPQQAIEKYRLGWCPKELFYPRTEWGLETEGKKLWFPKGIVIPSTEADGTIIRMKIRQHDQYEGDSLARKYVAISGSAGGMTIIGDKNAPVAVVVESELDAYAIHYILQITVCVIAIGSNMKHPDAVTDFIAQRAKQLFIIHDNDPGGEKMWEKWHSLYPHAAAYPTPIGKDIGEALQQGFDVRQWIIGALSD